MFGEKLKEIRKRFGLSQEDLAEKLNVSRQAITKWENNNGLPDTGNLKEISSLFNITIDYLLDNTSDLPNLVMREKIDLDNYDKSKYKDKYEAILKSRFGNQFDIYVLIRSKKMNKLEWLFDFIIGAGTVNLADALNDMTPYYLIENGYIQLLVNISKDYIETREISPKFRGNKCIISGNKFIKTKIKI